MPAYKDKKSGTWYVSYSFKDLPTGTFKKKFKRGFESKAAAKRWERENYNNTNYSEDKTFEELASEWEKTSQASEESKRHYSEHIIYRLGSIKNKSINDISVRDITNWRMHLGNDDNWSTRTKNNTITFVKSVFKYANIMYGTKDTAAMLKRFKPTNDEIMQEMNIWTPEEFNQFLMYVEDYTLQTYFSFLFWTGCRRGEAVALQKKDVRDGKVYIQYSQRSQKEGLKPTKTKQKRMIDLDDQLYGEILELMTSEIGPYVFGGDAGLAPTSIDRAFKEAIKKSGVKQIRIHDLRHSHASWLINSDVNIVAVSKRLGHSSIEQTLKTYTHLLEQSDVVLMNTINEYRSGENPSGIRPTTDTNFDTNFGQNMGNSSPAVSGQL